MGIVRACMKLYFDGLSFDGQLQRSAGKEE